MPLYEVHTRVISRVEANNAEAAALQIEEDMLDVYNDPFEIISVEEVEVEV